jgi:cofilin
MDHRTAHTKTGGDQIVFLNKAEGTQSISTDCYDAFEAMRLRRKSRYIIFKIGEAEINIEKLGSRGSSYEDLKSDLPFTDCRYAIYDQDYVTNDGRPASKIWFISWFPNNSTPYNKMAYTSAKTKFREQIAGVFDIQCSRYLLPIKNFLTCNNIVYSLEEMDAQFRPRKEEDEDDGDFDF